MPPVQNPGFLQPGSPGHSYFSVPVSFGVFVARHRNTSENDPALGCHFSAFSLGSSVVCFPCGSVIKNAPAYVDGSRDAGSIPGWGRSPGRGNGNPLQYSFLENPMDRGAW